MLITFDYDRSRRRGWRRRRRRRRRESGKRAKEVNEWFLHESAHTMCGEAQRHTNNEAIIMHDHHLIYWLRCVCKKKRRKRKTIPTDRPIEWYGVDGSWFTCWKIIITINRYCTTYLFTHLFIFRFLILLNTFTHRHYSHMCCIGALFPVCLQAP